MIKVFCFAVVIIATLAIDPACRKLNFFGNNIQNKALLSPVIIIGQRGMKIPFSDDLYKATIDIKTILKGSLGDWKKTILIAGKFSSKNDSTDLCHFTSESEETRIYFLDVISSQNGEYQILFNSEIFNQENLNEINNTICQSCAESPQLIINKQSKSDNREQLDCISESKPLPIIKWINSNGKSRTKVALLRNGARLIVTPSNDIIEEMFTCTGANLLGVMTSGIIIRDQVFRCETNDNRLCSDHGKCYRDKIDGGLMFCRCNEGFYGQNCSIDASKLSNNKASIQRSKNTDISEPDKEGFRKMIDTATSKVALKYLIIGGAIVLGGCVIVIIVLLIVWRCYFIRRLRTYEDNQASGTNLRLNGNSHQPLVKFNEGVILLPGNTERSIVPTQSKKAAMLYNDPYQRQNIDQFSTNGVYEGINETHN